MSRGKKKPLLSVAQIFNKCQEGVSGHTKYSKILWDVQEAEPEKCWNEFLFCLEHLLALPEVCPNNSSQAAQAMKKLNAIRRLLFLVRG